MAFGIKYLAPIILTSFTNFLSLKLHNLWGFVLLTKVFKVNTYLEGFAIVSDIFSGRTILVPHQMSAIEKFSFRSSNDSEK